MRSPSLALAALALAAPLSAQTMSADKTELGILSAEQATLFLTAGAPFAGHLYFAAGTTSGTVPGIAFQGFTIPLNPDFYFFLTVNNPGAFPLFNGTGTLDGTGWASAQFQVGPTTDLSLVGLTVSHAYVTIDPLSGLLSGASNAVDIDLVPGMPASTLVVNEVDYAQLAGDPAEFVEIYHAGTSTFDTSTTVVEFVDGATGLVYMTVDLSVVGSLSPGDYVVIADNGVTVAPGVATIPMPVGGNAIQDGPADAIRIVDVPTGVVRDAVAYDGTLPGIGEGTSDLVFDPPGAGEAAIMRCPDGHDTDDNDADFAVIKIATPGSPNPCG